MYITSDAEGDIIMELTNQTSALSSLEQYAKADRHTILISGVKGCGKTYIAQQYAKLLKTNDFYIVNPKIEEIREIMDSAYMQAHKVVVCIENLETGVVGVSNAILKFIEEPSENLYIVVTCRNPKMILDTIHSRCASIHLSHISSEDLREYASKVSKIDISTISKDVWKCINTPSDIDLVTKYTESQIAYIKAIPELVGSSLSVSTMIWKISNFSDNTPTNLEFIVKYLMLNTTSPIAFEACHKCLQALDLGRISSHAILAKLCFSLKYIT